MSASTPHPYQVEISPAAARQLRKLDRQVARQVVIAVAELGRDPRPPGSRQLTGRPDRWRIRVRRNWRVVYTVEDGRLVVLVLAIAHRREVYDR